MPEALRPRLALSGKSPRIAYLAATAAVLVAATSCARLPRPGAEFTQVGVASWYGNEFHGRPTSSGEVFDANDLTAAHRTLPFGTHVMVTNLENDRSVVVRINDRGPFVRGRIIDLSYAAARTLRLVGPGTAKVRLDILRIPAAPPQAEARGVWVQVGAFAVQENAHKLKRELEGSYSGVSVSAIKTDRGAYFRVRIRADETTVQDLARRLANQGYPVIIVRE